MTGYCVYVSNESRKRELKTRPIYECRCDERLKSESEKSLFTKSTSLTCSRDQCSEAQYFFKKKHTEVFTDKSKGTQPPYPCPDLVVTRDTVTLRCHAERF